jgi:23S rRNA pseudouridine1911/1915/1917 synthase
MHPKHPHLQLLQSLTIPKQFSESRLQEAAVGLFKNISTKSSLKKVLKKKLICLNGKVATTADFVRGGENLELFQDMTSAPHVQIELPVEVLFEDDHLAFVYKPSGIAVSGNKKWTLENALHKALEPSSQFDALSRPDPIHRLDYATSGVLLVGKTSTAVIALNQLFETRKIEKTYLAVAIGEIIPSGSLENKIDGKDAKTSFALIDRIASPRFGFLNLVTLQPETGRKHQIRKHLSDFGNPILGDRLYGKETMILKGKGLYLHASNLAFIHPVTNENMRVSAKVPKKILKLFPNNVAEKTS